MYLINKIKKTEKWILGTVVGAILLSIVSSYLYDTIFSNSEKEIKIKQDSIIKKISDNVLELETSNNLSKEILKRINQIAKDKNRKIQDLIRENIELRNKIKKLSFANIFPILQNKIIKLISEYKYSDARNIIIDFIKKNKKLNNEVLSKLYYQLSITYFAERKIYDAKKNIELSIKYDNTNPEILSQYNQILKYIIDQKMGTKQKKDIVKQDMILDIFPDKMNILYKGIENPVTLVVGPRVNKVKISADCKITKKKQNKYIISLTKFNKNQLDLVIEATLNNGENYTKHKIFRVLSIPKPVSSIDGEIAYVRIPKKSLLNKQIEVILPGFIYNLPLEISSFKIMFKRDSMIKIKGNKFIGKQFNKLLKKINKGDFLYIIDIKAYLKNSNYQITKVSNLVIEII